MAGDSLQLEGLKTAANGMGDSALQLKKVLSDCNTLVVDKVNSGKGIWDGQSAAAFATKFDELSNKITPLVNEAITIADGIKGATKAIGEVDGSVSEAAAAPPMPPKGGSGSVQALVK